MRKFIISIFVLTTFTFCLTSHLKAQNYNDVRYSDALEHLKMMEQFVGKWQTDGANDTVWIFEIIPSDVGEGYRTEYYRIVNGKAENTFRGIIGSSGPQVDRQIVMYILFPNGFAHRYVGKFLSEKKLVGYRYNLMHTDRIARWEWEMKTPDKFEYVSIWRGWAEHAENWEKKATVNHQTWRRVKE